MINPLVSIVIPTYNRKKSLERLLKSILSSTYKRIEIIVIDDASEDGTLEYITQRFNNSKVSIYRNKMNLFAAGSRNEGIKRARGKLIFFIDDDNVVDKKMIESMVEIIQKDLSIGELGPVNYSCSNKKKILWAGTKRNMTTTQTNQLRSLDKVKGSSVWDTDDVLNAYLVRSDILKRNKIKFDVRYGIMYEESDLAYRISKAGYRIKVVKDAIIYHDVEKKTDDKKSLDYMYHFMNDARRPFVFARNRIIFHSNYSTKIQMVGIIILWSWIFAAYYVYKLMFYNGYGSFSLGRRIYLSFRYISGVLAGIFWVFSNRSI